MKPPTFLSNGTSLNYWSRCCFNMRLTCYDRCSATWAGVQHHVLRERTQMNLKKSLNLIVTFPPKDTLTRAFFTLLVLWVVLVTPHVAFQDKTLHGEMYSVGTLFEVQYSLVGYDNMWHVAQVNISHNFPKFNLLEKLYVIFSVCLNCKKLLCEM